MFAIAAHVFLAILAPAGDARMGAGVPDVVGAIGSARRFAAQGDDAGVIQTLAGIPGEQADDEVQHLRARANARLGRNADARRAYLAAIERNHARAGDHFELGQLYAAEGKWGLALTSFEACEGLGLLKPELHEAMALAQAALHNYRGARVSRRCPGAAAGRILGDWYVWGPAPEQPDEFVLCPRASAIYHVAKALALGGESVRLDLIRAEACVEAREFAAARAIYEQLEPRLAPQDRAKFLHRYAETLLALDDLDGYVARVEEAARIDPAAYEHERAAAYEYAAARCNTEGDLERYIRYVELAAQSAAPSADLHYRLGNAYWEAQRRDDATRQWRIALELAPAHPDAPRMLGLLRELSLARRGAVAKDEEHP